MSRPVLPCGHDAGGPRDWICVLCGKCPECCGCPTPSRRHIASAEGANALGKAWRRIGEENAHKL